MEVIKDYLWLGGLFVVGLVLVQALFMAVDMMRHAAYAKVKQQLDLRSLQARVEAERKSRVAAEQKSLDWVGFRKFLVKRKQLEDAAGQVCSFYLSAHDGKPIPAYEPGQFLTFQLNIPGQAKPLVRCYSLSDAPGSDHLRVTIKRVPPPRDQPDVLPGVGSNFFHDHVNEGDLIDVRSPSGQFCLDPLKATPVVLIGGGIGVTPILSMLNAIIASGRNRQAWLFYGIRNKQEHIMAEHLQAVARDHPNVQVRICYSSPTATDQLDVDYHHAERVSVELLKRVLPSNNYEFYMCGPPPMMDALVDALQTWGVPADTVHLEKFGPSARKKTKKPKAPAAVSPNVTFKKSGKTVKWDPTAEHLWEFAAANDVAIDSGCLEGNCGTCLTAIVSGQVKYTKQPSVECEQGTCLVCCCIPKGPVELDA
jgi:ferredoxin-NADP reductase